MEFLGRSKHTFESGTIAAAFGGTTTVIDFTIDLSMQGGSLIDTVERRRAKAEGKAVIDFAFHCLINNGADATLAEIEKVVAYGIPSFKLFTVYREANLYVNDATLYNVMERLRDSAVSRRCTRRTPISSSTARPACSRPGRAPRNTIRGAAHPSRR